MTDDAHTPHTCSCGCTPDEQDPGRKNTPFNDTVDAAIAEPKAPQPYRKLGLKDDEYARITSILGRRPTDAELAMYSVMWSEHCSYKSSKVHLRYFGETTTDEMNSKILAGIGENAGVVDIGDGWAVTFRVESHNHPSYVEPHQGAATGVGGIVRDIMAMGARPIAVMDQLRFGPADAPDTKRVLPGVIDGVGGYGNCLGLPNIGGETVFDECYAGNPLVNALCVGKLKVDDLKLAFASGKGNKVILFGSRTGLDGIGGVSVLASDTFTDGAERKLPAVQVGDPFAEKVLIECCLDLYKAGVVVGIQDLGGAGLSCATSELAAAGDGGMVVDLDKVALRAPDMTAAEILSSESQERMCAVVTPDNVAKFKEICRHWDVICSEIGEVTEGDHLVIYHRGEKVVDAPAHTIAHQGPVYDRPYSRPDWQSDVQVDGELDIPTDLDEIRDAIFEMTGSADLCSRKFITDQYDRYVLGNTVEAYDCDAGVLRIDEKTRRGVAVSTDCSGRYTLLDPMTGARLALAEAYRNVSITGATPWAVTNCLNFGSPENPDVMWQFEQAVHGLADGCKQLGIPVSGGNVSFYNQTGSEPIQPTPLVGVLGVIDDVADAIDNKLGKDIDDEPEQLFLLGTTLGEWGGSIWQKLHGTPNLAGMPPAIDLEDERRLMKFFTSQTAKGARKLVTAAHDLSEGGLGQALVEMAIQGAGGKGIGISVDLEVVHPNMFTALYSESASRVVVACKTKNAAQLEKLAKSVHISCARLGSTGAVGAAAKLRITGKDDRQIVIKVADLAKTWYSTLENEFGHAVGANSVVE